MSTDGGIPGGEQAFLNFVFRCGSVITSDRKAARSYKSEATDLLKLFDDLDFTLASNRVRIPRMMGIEESSRHWSVLMVFHHLNQVNGRIIEIIRELHRDLEPQDQVSLADFKPDPNCDVSVISDFEVINLQFDKLIDELAPLKRRTSYPHPWFGYLTAHHWACLAAVHMRIHRRQAKKIVAMQGLA